MRGDVLLELQIGGIGRREGFCRRLGLAHSLYGGFVLGYGGPFLVLLLDDTLEQRLLRLRQDEGLGGFHEGLQLRLVGREVFRVEEIGQTHVVETYPVLIVAGAIAGHRNRDVEHAVAVHPGIDAVEVFLALVELIFDIASRGGFRMAVGGDFIPILDEHLVVVGLHVGVGEAESVVAECLALCQHRGSVERLHIHAVEARSQSRDLLTHSGLRAGGVLYLIRAVADSRSLYVVHRPSRRVAVHRGILYFGSLIGGAHSGERSLQFCHRCHRESTLRSDGGGARCFCSVHQRNLLRGGGPLPLGGVFFTLFQHQLPVVVDGQEVALCGISHLRGLVDAAQQDAVGGLNSGPFVIG